MSLKIFLCYANEDRADVLRLYQRLKSDGFQPWMSNQDLLSGQRWEPEITKEVKASHVAVVCLTSSFVSQEGFRHQELMLVLEAADLQPEDSIFVIPLRLDKCAVPNHLQRWHWCDYFEEDGHNRLLKSLRHRAQELGIEVTLPPPPPPPPYRPTNQHFPVTLDDWRYELVRRNTTFGTPAGYWCYVRPGTYRIGEWERDQPSADIALPGYWVAKHPITKAQYRQFLDAGGYASQQWWTPHGGECWTPHGGEWKKKNKRTEPYLWYDQRFNSDNQPVVGISWYEGVAFACWLSNMLKADLPDNTCIRLPTEAEWEVAATYDAQKRRRSYPWGEEVPTTDRAVYKDRGIKRDRPAPVGEHPRGAAACGAHDMGGNVWEMTASSYTAYPAQSDLLVEDVPSNNLDVPWRGGSRGQISTCIRCNSREKKYPHDRDCVFGVRLVVSPLCT